MCHLIYIHVPVVAVTLSRKPQERVGKGILSLLLKVLSSGTFTLGSAHPSWDVRM